MKKQSAAGLFFSILLKAVVIILGLAIIGFGIFFIIKVLKTDKTDNTPTTTVSDNVLTEVEAHDDLLYETATEAVTEAPVPEQTEPADGTSYNRNILILNSTDVTGLAGRWCGRLNDYGYVYTTASDFATLQDTTRVIAKEEGVGQDLVQFFNGASYEVGTVTEGASVSTDEYDIVIIIGSADNDGQ
ncbi:MAG: LytR C-terminal domain-containing protein [Lachnospiraceae bacterium]|nr:LytR C-terminal domain-containing protein [Lachnospiraceae bacterium]